MIAMFYLPSKHNLKASTKREAIDSRNYWLLTATSAKSTEPAQGMSHKTRTGLDLSAPDLAEFNQVLTCTEALLSSTRDDGYA
jgi:hypothetical protein